MNTDIPSSNILSKTFTCGCGSQCYRDPSQQLGKNFQELHCKAAGQRGTALGNRTERTVGGTMIHHCYPKGKLSYNSRWLTGNHRAAKMLLPFAGRKLLHQI